MVRELAALAASLLALTLAGCSFLLDFSDGAIPRDAQPDAPYSQAECDYKEPNNSLAAAAAITPTDTGPAAICPGLPEDHDFYRFTVPAGTTKVLVQISTMYRMGGDLDLRLYDRTGAMLARSTGFSDDEVIDCPNPAVMCPALAAGDYVFEVYPGTARSVNRYTFSVAFTP
ncbi:MAG TPA: PPC domain-containing protein [Kofleriaceae bacterium]